MRQIFTLVNFAVKRRACEAITAAPEGYVVEIKPATRNLEQNALLWACLTEISKQVEWYGKKLTPENWKDILTAALKKSEVAPGIDGGFVVLGTKTSQMSKQEFSDLISIMLAFCVERGVKLSNESELTDSIIPPNYSGDKNAT